MAEQHNGQEALAKALAAAKGKATLVVTRSTILEIAAQQFTRPTAKEQHRRSVRKLEAHGIVDAVTGIAAQMRVQFPDARARIVPFARHPLRGDGEDGEVELVWGFGKEIDPRNGDRLTMCKRIVIRDIGRCARIEHGPYSTTDIAYSSKPIEVADQIALFLVRHMADNNDPFRHVYKRTGSHGRLIGAIGRRIIHQGKHVRSITLVGTILPE
jgi:hypothetical protein